MTRHIFKILLATVLPLLASTALAEKADAQKEKKITADHSDVDNVNQVYTYTGNVVVTQGTLILKGAKLVDTTTKEGYNYAILYAPAGGRATMRQKRDGGPDLWMEGEAADKITYEEKSSEAKLFVNAKVRRLTGVKTTDESDGAYLSYNSQTEIVTGANNESGVSKPGEGQVTVTIQPHVPEAPKGK